VDLVTNDPDTDWPPWWPPWGPGPGDKDKKKDRRTPVEKAHDLAKEVVEFESRVANTSLDL
jgi:endothelin-converting enzyme